MPAAEATLRCADAAAAAGCDVDATPLHAATLDYAAAAAFAMLMKGRQLLALRVTLPLRAEDGG